MVVELNFINDSNDQGKPEVVIFQKNIAKSFEELAVAWRVIQNCGRGANHRFIFPMTYDVVAADCWGNYTPKLAAQNGQMFEVKLDAAGDQLVRSTTPSTSSEEVQMRNSFPRGAINANVYKDGLLLATETAVAPGQKAVFRFKPTIWIGVVSQVVEGQVMDLATLSQINTELSLLGIASADIVMTGGGPGANSQPFSFTLENVQLA